MTKDGKDLARRTVAFFIGNQADDFAQVAKLAAQDCGVKESIEKGLLEIAKGEGSFEDIHLREAALNVMAVLGLTKSQDVHRELCDLFTVAFDKEALQELAAFEALPKTKRCGLLCSKMNFLQSLLRALLHVNEERGLIIGREVAEIFTGTRFSGKITRWVTSASQL